MQTISKYWSQLFAQRKQRRWRRLIEKHYTIAKEGLNLSAKAVRVYDGENSYKDIRLVRFQLQFELLDGSKAVTVSKCLLNKCPSLLEGRTIHFKFLPGDLSQIVLVH